MAVTAWVVDRTVMNAEDVLPPHLTTFTIAAELCNFTGAAETLGVSQAAVSQHVHALEKTLGKSLFDRRGGRLLLTDAGRQLYSYTQLILDLHRTARREITGRDVPATSGLDIAASSIPGEHLLPSLLSAFGKKHPHVRVRAGVGDSAMVTKQVERGEVSFGLVGRRAENPNLEFRFLTSDRMVLVVPAGHSLSKKKSVTVDQLVAHPLVMREAGSGLRHCFEKSLDRAGRSLAELRVALELGSNEAIKEAVIQGVGVAILSALAVQRELAGGRFVTLRVQGIHCDRDMFVVLDKRRVLPLPARLFLTFLEANPVAGLTS